MSAEWDEKSVFLAALSLPEERRAAFLQDACRDQAGRRRIENLLRHHAKAEADYLTSGPTIVSRSPDSVRQVDEFRILHLLGEGGMGRVYLAEDTVLGRRVALKLLSRHLTGSEAAVGRFRSEARSAATLKHPGIVPVFRFGLAGDEHYLVSEFVDGQTLSHFISAQRARHGAQTAPEQRAYRRRAAEIAAAVADALDAAHREKIIHRDVKPSNILLEHDGRPRLTDFGIAKQLSDEPRAAQTKIIGTCHYMSPEQASIAGAEVDQRSDVFSLGVVLYELLALRRPFEGADDRQVLRAVIETDPAPLRKADPRTPRDLETICLKAMEKDPRRRYQSAAHVAADLRSYLADQPILAIPPTLGRRMGRWVSRRRLSLAFGACVGLAAISGGLIWLLRNWASEQQAWLSVSCEQRARVYIQAVEPATLEHKPVRRFIGSTPLSPIRFPTGQYRVSVVDPQTDCEIEVNWLALDPGSANQTTIIVHNPDSTLDWRPSDRRVLRGVFRRGPDAAPADMTLVAGGDYMTGWSSTTVMPVVRRQRVRVEDFYLDLFEVTNAEYKEFLAVTQYPEPECWQTHPYDSTIADHPVVGIRLEEAEAYARWRGKRLPTAFEWQAAARGADGFSYPWGNEWEAGPTLPKVSCEDLEAAYSWDETEHYVRYQLGSVPAHSDDSLVTSAGVHFLFGNVRELTATVDLAKRDVYIYGRSWADPPRRSELGNTRTRPLATYSFQNGFRCAASAKATRSTTRLQVSRGR